MDDQSIYSPAAFLNDGLKHLRDMNKKIRNRMYVTTGYAFAMTGLLGFARFYTPDFALVSQNEQKIYKDQMVNYYESRIEALNACKCDSFPDMKNSANPKAMLSVKNEISQQEKNIATVKTKPP